MGPSVADALVAEPTRPLRRVEYDRLVELGAFQDERIELLEGRLVVMSPQGAAHAWVVERLTELLVIALQRRARVRPQLPLALSDLSEPEPDLAVVEPGDDLAEHPSSALLVVEVAESSVRRDRDVKALLYAQGDVAEYWLVDLVEETVTVHRGRLEGRYRDVSSARRGDTVAPVAFPDVTLEVSDFLPPLRR